MKNCAIIAEYNPFHNGHAYQIEQVRKKGFTHVTVIMSGNYVQRGDTAIAQKQIRAAAACECGADLVIDLPTPWAMAGAQRFAYGAVFLADSLGCADSLCFGSECADMHLLEEAARAVSDERVINRTKELLPNPISYAAARMQAAAEYYGDDVAGVLQRPNDILAVEYLLQLKKQNSSMNAFAVKRKGHGHDTDSSYRGISSAAEIRRIMHNDMESASKYMPEPSFRIYEYASIQGRCPADISRIETAALASARIKEPHEFSKLPDISGGLDNLAAKSTRSSSSYGEAVEKICGKRYTRARARRILLSSFLGLDAKLAMMSPPYIRILAQNERGREIIAALNSSLPVSHSAKKLRESGPAAQRCIDFESRATDMYVLTLPKPRGCGEEYSLSSYFAGKPIQWE